LLFFFPCVLKCLSVHVHIAVELYKNGVHRPLQNCGFWIWYNLHDTNWHLGFKVVSRILENLWTCGSSFKFAVCLILTSRTLACRYQHFGGTCCFHLQSYTKVGCSSFLTNHRYLSAKLHDFVSWYCCGNLRFHFSNSYYKPSPPYCWKFIKEVLFTFTDMWCIIEVLIDSWEYFHTWGHISCVQTH
jgi:hypothetical protein